MAKTDNAPLPMLASNRPAESNALMSCAGGRQTATGQAYVGHGHTAHRNNPDASNAKDQQSTEDLAADWVRVDVMLGSPISRRLPRLRQLSSYFSPRRGGCFRLMRRRWAGEERLSTICYA